MVEGEEYGAYEEALKTNRGGNRIAQLWKREGGGGDWKKTDVTTHHPIVGENVRQPKGTLPDAFSQLFIGKNTPNK